MRSASVLEPIGSAAICLAFSTMAAIQSICACCMAIDSSASASSMAALAASAPAASVEPRELSCSARCMASILRRSASNMPGFGNACSKPTMMSPSSLRIIWEAPMKPTPTIGSFHRRTERAWWAAACALNFPATADGCARAASDLNFERRPSFRSCDSPAWSRLPATARPARK